jgi:UDP-galactopyranose mutase
LETPNYQGTAIMNYTAREIPYTRIIEHKHFEFGQQAVSIITHEYPEKWDTSKEPYYPINTSINDNLYKRYSILAESLKHTFFCGRLGEYKYYNMDQIVVKSLEKYVEIKKHILRIKRNINTQIIRD